MARWTEDREHERGRYGQDERPWRGEEGWRERGDDWRSRDWREDERGTEWRGGERGDWQGGAREWEGRDRDRERGRQGGGHWGTRGEMGREGMGEWDRDREWRSVGRGGYGPGWRGDEGRRGGGRGFDERESGFMRDMRRQAGEEEPGTFERMGERMKEGLRRLTGKGPKGYRRSDERIRDDVSERIARSGVDAEDVEVKVEKGEVTLTGFVRRREEKRMIEDLADDVFGVDEVNNHLRIRREELTTQGQTLTGTQGQGQVLGQGTASGAGQVGQRGQTQPPGARH
jgi:hypothetical protein